MAVRWCGKVELVLFTPLYIEYRDKSQVWRIPMEKEERKVEVRGLPEMTVAYVRHIGPCKGDTKEINKIA